MAKLLWNLRAIMAARKIDNDDLGRAIGSHEGTISRLRSHDTLPAIGNERIREILNGINQLSEAKYGHCKMQDLVAIVEDEESA